MYRSPLVLSVYWSFLTAACIPCLRWLPLCLVLPLNFCAARQSKYIGQLMKEAKKRNLQEDLRKERAAQREREREGEEFADKDKFVTSAFKKKMEELKRAEAEEAALAAKEGEPGPCGCCIMSSAGVLPRFIPCKSAQPPPFSNIRAPSLLSFHVPAAEDVTKRGDINGFYRNMFSGKSTADGQAAPAAEAQGDATGDRAGARLGDSHPEGQREDEQRREQERRDVNRKRRRAMEDAAREARAKKQAAEQEETQQVGASHRYPPLCSAATPFARLPRQVAAGLTPTPGRTRCRPSPCRSPSDTLAKPTQTPWRLRVVAPWSGDGQGRAGRDRLWSRQGPTEAAVHLKPGHLPVRSGSN